MNDPVIAFLAFIIFACIAFYAIFMSDKLIRYFKTKYKYWRLKKELTQLYRDLKINNIYNIYESQYNKFSQHKQTITILDKDNGFIKYRVVDYTSMGCTRTYEESSHIKEFYNNIYKYRYISLRDVKI